MGQFADRAREIFKAELALIKKPELVEFVLTVFDTFGNENFFTRQGSSSSRYHPIFDMGVGGLVRHSRAVAQIASRFSRTMGTGRNSDHPQGEDWGPYHDVLVAAAIIHDLLKDGDPKRVMEPARQGRDGYKWIGGCHGVDLCEALWRDVFKGDPSKISHDQKLIMYAVAGHMGPWTLPQAYQPRNQKDPEIRAVAEAMHASDYFAAQKWVDGLLIECLTDPAVIAWAEEEVKKKVARDNDPAKYAAKVLEKNKIKIVFAGMKAMRAEMDALASPATGDSVAGSNKESKAATGT